MVAKSIAKIYTNIHKPTDYQVHKLKQCFTFIIPLSQIQLHAQRIQKPTLDSIIT